MIKSDLIDCHPSRALIIYHQIIKYIIVGRYLHGMTLIGIIIIALGIQNTITAFHSTFSFIDYVLFYTIFQGIGIIFSTQLDAYGRYQNYKQLKDSLFIYGFDPRIIRPFTQSKCQRDAVLAAAGDLNYDKQVKLYFYKRGYRWYHMFPDSFINNPLVIFNNNFMLGILFTNKYQLKYFYW